MEIKYSLKGLADKAMHFAENKQLIAPNLRESQITVIEVGEASFGVI